MINYKEHRRFPYQIKKYNTLIEEFHRKAGLFHENLEEDSLNSFNYMMFNQKLLIDDIFTACENKNNDQLCLNLKHLYGYLKNKQPQIFPLLINSSIISKLIELTLPESIFKCRKTAYLCLYNITALYSETTPILLNNGILNVFYNHIYNTKFNSNSSLNIDGIVNLLVDEPRLINQIMEQLPMSKFVGQPPFNDIISMFLTKNKNIFYSLNRLFIIYLENSASQSDIDLMLKFYIACIRENLKNQQDDLLLYSGLNGINNYLMICKIQEKQYDLLTKIDFIDISDKLNEQYKKLKFADKENADKYLANISFCFDIFSRFSEYSLSKLNYDIRQIIKYCKYKPNKAFCHFDDKAGISAFELIATMLMNCEQDTIDTFLYCTKKKFQILEILYNAITKGSYFIVYPASVSLIQIIQGNNDAIINEKFIDEQIFEALLKMITIDDRDIQIKTIDSIRIIFNRSVINKNIDKCISAFDANYGCDILADCMNSCGFDELSKRCYNILIRFFPLE